jgi:hypothetical protein
MIRRWSCLIEINNNFDTTNLYVKKHKINVFKNSVNFKRFCFKFTKFKRKSLIRLKHRSNFLIYTNVLKYWIKDYLFNKNYNRYQYFNKIFLNNFFFYNFNFIKNRNETFFYNFNFIFSIFTNKNYFYFFKQKLSTLKYSPLTFGWTSCTPIANSSVLPIYSSYENNLYPFTLDKKEIFDFDELFNSIFNISLINVLEIRKILILLFFNNLIKFKNVK